MWAKGFWLKMEVPIYQEPAHHLIGTLVIQKELSDLTREYKNYENLGNTGETLLCYPYLTKLLIVFPPAFQIIKIY